MSEFWKRNKREIIRGVIGLLVIVAGYFGIHLTVNYLDSPTSQPTTAASTN